MSETSLKFGPEWLRALSHGGSVSSPPSSPGPVKFKLAEYRYGREEMLALFCRELSPPDGLHNLGTLCIEEVQEPLAFTPMNPEEQRIWQRCVNSDAVLRSSGRAAPLNGVGRGRGGSVERGRGRGRGVGAPYYSRGISYDEESEARTPREAGPPGMGMSLRAKVFERSQSVNDSRGWGGERVPSERGPSERCPGGGSEERGGAVSPRKEPPRSFTENWRTRGGLDEDGDRWRALSNSKEKWVGRGARRERENGAEGEWEESKGPNGGPQRNLRLPWESDRDKDGQRRQWEEDNLPEWVTESAEDKGGSFDATGAFHAPGSSDEDEGSEYVTEKTKLHKARMVRNEREKSGSSKIKEDGNSFIEAHDWSKEHLGSTETYNDDMKCLESKGSKNDESNGIVRHTSPIVNGVLSDDDKSLSSQSLSQCKEHQIPMSISPPHLQKSFQVEDDKLEHMQSAADDLVAKLVEDDEPRSNEDNARLHHPPPGGFISTEHLPLQDDQWFYTDPQGDIQGPFSSADMAAWCKAGYFKPDLLLRRFCDDKFAQLGDLTRVFGRVPFLPGPAVPPLKVSELLNAQKAERERYELMQAYHMQKQLYQQQTTLRQQQILQQLQSLEEWSSLNTGQQQQLFVQQMMSLPPLVAPVLPAGLQGSSTTVSTSPATVPTTSIDHRTNISNAPPQDPIQAFVAQMSTSNSVIPSAVSTELTIPPPSSLNSGSITSESPLQKLLLQLQRGSQQQNNMGNNSLNLSSTIPTSHPSILGQTSINSVGVEKPPEQFDAIQSLMNQLSKIQSTDSLQHEELKQREEEQKRIEEERKLFEEQKRAEEERMRLQEIRLQEERIKEEERRKELEQKNQRLEEELRRIQEEQTQRRKEDDSKFKQQEEKRKQEHQQKSAELQKKEEDQKRHQVKQKQKQLEEENRRREIEKRLEEAKKRRMEEENRKQEEERKKKEENEKQHQMQIQEEMRRMALEEERQRMQQLEEEERIKAAQEEHAKKNQLLLQQKVAIAAQQEKLKQVPPAWNNKANAKEESYAPSLAEIQKAQEVKERKEREAESLRESQRQKEAHRLATEEKKKKEAKLKWASRVGQSVKSGNKTASSQAPPVKSLLEIQKEEEKELKKSQEKEFAERAAAISHLSLNAAGVWGSAAQSLSWANRASSGAPTNISSSNITSSNSQGPQNDWGSSNSSNTMAWSAVAQNNANSQANSCWNSDSSSWTQPASQTSGGFWESPDSVKSSTKHSSAMGACLNQSPVKESTNQQGNNKNASSQAVTSNNKANKKKSKDESDNVKKLFADNISSPADNFTQWCKNSLHSMKVHASIDIPTFVGFLAEVESPYEVHDYIRSYLGDSKEVKEFAKQYLERRSKARNAQKEEHEDDNILAPAPAVNPVSSLEFQEVKTRLKKGKKKMQKVDNSILGFNVSSLERVGVEEGN